MADSSDEAREEIRAMRVKQIKAELEALSVPHADVLEKEDLVQRLMDARQVDRSEEGSAQGEDGQGEDGADSSAKPPSMGETMRQADILMADAEGPEVMAALQKDPRLMKAVMDISMNGDASKYADDAEVMALMRKLEGITKRGMASSQEYNPFPDNA
jgi:citrate lyase alpha subunit